MDAFERDLDRSPSKTVRGVTFTNIQYGQKRAYADSTYEYEATSDLPADQVKAVLCEHAHKCDLPIDRWKAENRENPSMACHFRNHYEFQDRGDGKFFYRVTSPFAD